MQKTTLSFATWLRAVSAILILACHYCQQNNNVYIKMLSQFLNIGVHIFFILSGFLLGYQGHTKPYHIWYKKRFYRIFIPYWLFLFVLAVVHIVQGRNVLTLDWLQCVIGIQGSKIGVLGAEHTWFITVLLLCYLITPVLSEITGVLDEKHSALKRIYLVLTFLMPVVFALFPEAWVYTILTPISFYSIAFVAGRFYDVQYEPAKKHTVLSLLLILIAFLLRLVGRLACDGTILYDRIIVPYTHFTAACAIFYLFVAFCSDAYPPKIVKFVSAISFEIYLYHYMLTAGPISLFGKTPNWTIDCLLITGIVIVIAFIFNRFSLIWKKRNTKTKN